MFHIIYTKSLDNVDELEANTIVCETIDTANELFDRLIKQLIDDAIANELIKLDLSMHGKKALIRVGSTHYVIVIKKVN